MKVRPIRAMREDYLPCTCVKYTQIYFLKLVTNRLIIKINYLSLLRLSQRSTFLGNLTETAPHYANGKKF